MLGGKPIGRVRVNIILKQNILESRLFAQGNCYIFRREGEYICEKLSETGRLCTIDLVEVNPTLGDESGVSDTANMAISLLCHALGKRHPDPIFKRSNPYSPEGARERKRPENEFYSQV